MRKYLFRSVTFSIVTGVVAALSIYFLARLVLPTALPEKWSEAWILLEIFVMIIPARFIYVSNSYLFHALDKLSRALITNILILLAATIPWFLMLPFPVAIQTYSIALAAVYCLGCLFMWQMIWGYHSKT